MKRLKCRAAGGVEALLDTNRKKPNLHNRVEEATEAAVKAFALEQSAFGQVRLSNELRKHGVFISPSGVRSVWLFSIQLGLSPLSLHILSLDKRIILMIAYL